MKAAAKDGLTDLFGRDEIVLSVLVCIPITAVSTKFFEVEVNVVV